MTECSNLRRDPAYADPRGLHQLGRQLDAESDRVDLQPLLTVRLELQRARRQPKPEPVSSSAEEQRIAQNLHVRVFQHPIAYGAAERTVAERDDAAICDVRGGHFQGDRAHYAAGFAGARCSMESMMSLQGS